MQWYTDVPMDRKLFIYKISYEKFSNNIISTAVGGILINDFVKSEFIE